MEKDSFRSNNNGSPSNNTTNNSAQRTSLDPNRQTTSSDFVLQWGKRKRKRLRCMKVQVKDVSTTPVHKTIVRVDRRVVRADHKDTPDHQPRSTNNNNNTSNQINGYFNLRQRPSPPPPPPPPPQRILREILRLCGCVDHVRLLGRGGGNMDQENGVCVKCHTVFMESTGAVERFKLRRFLKCTNVVTSLRDKGLCLICLFLGGVEMAVLGTDKATHRWWGHVYGSEVDLMVRNSENSSAMRGGQIYGGGLRRVASPDKGAHDKRGNNNHHHHNSSNNHENHNHNNKSVASSDSKKGGGSSSGGSGEAPPPPEPPVWPPKFVISLTNKEKEEDFFAFKGSKLPQRPKKRAKFIQRTLNLVSPGAWLCDLTLERYEVREKKITKKRPRGLKAMGNMDSDSE
ncbi:unnamed protein product [Dovyalis caffra]|uniref:Uncharacterized protein n=2 Tax=Magnoliopsida TaxID=3398 RepID=A0AAV1SNG0_9ROSI|nr:unnamed protein product [Dovyalis caffra]